MLSEMPVGMLNRMLSRILNTECLMKYLVEYLVECSVECSVKSTPQLHERTQALYRRFGMSGRQPSEPPGLSKCKLYIRDLAYQEDIPLELPSPANTSFISKIWHVRRTPL